MILINSDTNCLVAGIVVPVGQCEWPEEGTITIVTSGGWSNQVTVRASDTVLVDRTQVVVSAGRDPVWWFCGGLMIVLSAGLLIGFARYLARALGGVGRMEL